MNNETSRRQLLKIMSGVPLTSAMAGAGMLLTACGGDSGVVASTSAGKVTKVTFNGMANPSTDANRAAVYTNATIDITYENGSITRAAPLSYKTIYRTGDVLKDPDGNDIVAGGYFKPDGVTPILDLSVPAKAEQFYSDAPDGTSLLKLANPSVPGVSGNTLFAVTQFEYKTSDNAGNSFYGKLPSPIAVVTIDQNKSTGELKPVQYYNVPTEDVHGLWITCAGSLSPWNTHLSSEEYEPDAWSIASNSQFSAFSVNAFGSATAANPYHYGHVPEVTVRPNGTATIRKHYCMGRISRELVQVMPDNRTVLMGDDYTNGGIFMFVADVEKVLSSGTLYVAKVTQAADTPQDPNGGNFTVRWIKLGSATSQEIENLADSVWTNSNGLKAANIIDVQATETAGYSAVYLDGAAVQYVKVQTGMEKAAAFLETHRYANIKGASMEFTKMEGVAVNIKDKVAYLAMARIESTMQDGTGDVNVKKVLSGGVYAANLAAGQNDTDGTAINSAWVPTTLAIPDVSAPYTGKLLGEDLTPADADGNKSVVDKISCPDNLKFSEAMRTLFIGEDSGYHLNNYVWAYNVDTKVLSRVLSVPAGAECTGLQAVDNLNGYSYVMSAFQHAADWSFLSSQTALKEAVLTNYGPSAPSGARTVAKRAAVGYIAGIPVIG